MSEQPIVHRPALSPGMVVLIMLAGIGIYNLAQQIAPEYVAPNYQIRLVSQVFQDSQEVQELLKK